MRDWPRFPFWGAGLFVVWATGWPFPVLLPRGYIGMFGFQYDREWLEAAHDHDFSEMCEGWTVKLHNHRSTVFTAARFAAIEAIDDNLSPKDHDKATDLANRQTFAACVAGWSGLVDLDGEPVECTPEIVLQFCTEKEFDEFWLKAAGIIAEKPKQLSDSRLKN